MPYEFPFRDPSLSVDERLDDLMSRLTLEEKFGFIPTHHSAVPRLGIDQFYVGGEGAHGYIDRGEPATAFPQTIGMAATFDRELLSDIGVVTAKEARAHYNRTGKIEGITLWFPTVDLERSPYWGRTEEGYGEDPYLTSELAKAIITAAQNDNGTDPIMVTSGPKHFFANNNEFERGSCNCSITPRLLREYYTVPFKAAIKDAGAYSLMSSYNAVNGVPMILNPLLNSLVKEEWGMKGRGHIVTDGGAFGQTVTLHHYFTDDLDTMIYALRNGNDSMNEADAGVIAALRAAFDKGELTEEELDVHVRGILRVRMKLGQFDPSTPYDDLGREVVNCAEHIATARRCAAESCVLLKNDGVLPVKSGRIAVLGHQALTNHMDWYTSYMGYKVNILDGLKERYGADNVDYLETRDIVSLTTADGLPLVLRGEHNGLEVGRAGEEPARFYLENWGFGSYALRSVEFGLLLNLGHISKPNEIPTEEIMAERRRIESEHPARANAPDYLDWYVRTQYSFIPQGDGKVIIRSFDGAYAYSQGEGKAVGFGKLYAQNDTCEFRIHTEDSMTAAVSKLADYDAVVTVVGSNPMIHARECIDRPSLALPEYDNELAMRAAAANSNSVTLIVSSYPYDCPQVFEASNAVVWLAHGMQEMGNGVADTISGDVPPAGKLPMSWVREDDFAPDTIMQYDIMKGGMTYLWSEKPAHYCFGHGLTYARFTYSDLTVAAAENGLSISFRLTNESDFASDEVPQLYVKVNGSSVPRARRALKGFERVNVKAHESIELTFALPFEELAVWDVTRERFVVESGTVSIMVGSSSEDIRLHTEALVAGERIPPRALEGTIGAWNCDDYEDLEFIDKRGSTLPAVITNEKFGGEIVFRNCVTTGKKRIRIVCAGLDRTPAVVWVDCGEQRVQRVEIPFTGDVADWPHAPGQTNALTWQTIECDFDFESEEPFALRLLTTGHIAVHTLEFV